MQTKNLLSRLCTYSLNREKLSSENFLTEVFAYLFEEDKTFREVFLRVVVRDRRKIRRFRGAETKTQVPFNRSYVDLVLEPKRGKPLLVEVKIRASETWTDMGEEGHVPQVKKYIGLHIGPVVYLASVQAPDPDVADQRMYWGRATIEKIHQKLKKDGNYRKLTPMGKQLVGFLEEQGMSYTEPFTSAELKEAELAFGLVKKTKDCLNEAAEVYQEDFKKLFKSKSVFSRAKFLDDEGYVTWKGFDRRKFKWVGFGIAYYDGDIYFTVWVKIPRRSGMDEDARDARLYHYQDSEYWGERVSLRGGRNDKKRIDGCVKKAIKKFKKII